MNKKTLYNLAVIALLVLLLCMVWLLNAYPSLRAFDQYLKTPFLPTAMLDQGKKGKIMKQLGLVYAEVNDEGRYRKNHHDQQPESEELNLFQRKRRVGDYVYRVNTGGKANFPSQLQLVNAVKDPIIPHLSMAISQAALYDPSLGMLANAGQSGKEWERPATLSFYHGSQLTQAHNVGVRLFGEKKRRESLWQRSQYADSEPLDQSYQLFFRSKYSVQSIPGKLVFNKPNSPVLSSLVIERGDVVKQFLAFELWRIAGLTVPDYSAAFLHANNESLGIRLVREPVNRKQWLLRTDKPSLDFYRSDKGFQDRGWRWNVELNSWYKQVRGKLTMELVNAYIDLENLTKSIAVHMFCGSSDWSRWAIVRDRQTSNRWRWVEWSMDTCFSDQWSTSSGTIAEQHWLHVVMSKDISNRKWRATYHDLRTLIFVELMNNEPNYQAYFFSILEQMMQRFADEKNYSDLVAKENEAFERSHSKAGQSGFTLQEFKQFVEKRSRFINSQVASIFKINRRVREGE